MDELKIFENNQTTSRGTSLFPFQLVGIKIAVAFAQTLHSYVVVFLCRHFPIT